jgi:uncharacterized repeat protein (TIGR01451 family)
MWLSNVATLVVHSALAYASRTDIMRGRRRRVVRWGRSAGIVVALAAVVSASLGAPAGADSFDDNCTAPASPVVPPTPTATISLNPGQTLVIAAGTTYQGGINNFPAGARICVGAGATFTPPFVNNAAGAIYNRGTSSFPGLNVATGFVLDNFASTTFTSNLNFNGSATITNAAAATMTLTQNTPLSNASSFTNDGSLVFGASLTSDNGTQFTNRGSVSIAGDFTPNGSITNTGRIAVGGGMTANSNALVNNACMIEVTRGAMNNGELRLSGVLLTGNGDTFVNQGRLTFDLTGFLVGGSFTNNSQVNGGGGHMYFTGNTLNQGPMVGATPAAPLVFFDTTQTTGGIFDTNNAIATNVVRQSFTPPTASTISPGCTGAGADVTTTKAGPAQVVAGDGMSYTITVTNAGPLAATGITVTDTLPAGVTVTAAPPGATITPPTVSWPVASLAAGDTATFSLNVAVPVTASGTLVNTVGSTSATPDPNPANNNGTAAAARVTTTVLPFVPPNTAPSAPDQSRTTRVGVEVIALLTATDPDSGQTLTWNPVPVVAPANGTATIDPGGRFTYTPAAGFTGIDTVVVEVCDNGTPVLCAQPTVRITVTPAAIGDFATTTPSTPVVIDVAANDIGPATAPAVVTQPSNGTAAPGPGDSVTYTPNAGFTGIDTFEYEICAPGVPTACEVAVVTVIVAVPPNRPPIVGDVDTQTIPDAAVTFEVSASDPDPGQTVVFDPASVSGPTNGTATVAPDGTTTYTPNAGFTGVDTFEVQACDNGTPVLCATGTVVVTVPPVASGDAAATTVDTAVTIPILANDLGGASASMPALVTAPDPATGTAVINADGTLTFTPAPGFLGLATMTYQLCSANTPSLCNTAPVAIVVVPAPDGPPIVTDASRTIAVNTSATLTVAAADPNGDPVTFDATPVTGPTNGTATIAPDGTVTYTPNANFTGRDSFTVQACDPQNECGQGTVRITVTPIAREVTLTTFPGVPVVADIIANDSGDVGAPVIVGGPTFGVATINDDGEFVFIPGPDQTGIALVGYQICSVTAPDVCDTAVVVILVSPLAIPDTARTTIGQPVPIDVSANDLGAGTVALEQAPAHGSVNAVDGTFIYTPDPGFTGTDTFTYSLCDPPSQLCTSAAVTISVLPALVDDTATTIVNQPVDIAVLLNDLGATTPPSIASPPSNGTAVVNGTIVTYTPDPGYIGVDTFTYSECSPEARAACAAATVTVTVTEAPNTPPVLTAPVLTTEQDTAVSGAVTATDPEGQPVTFDTLPIDGPAHGTVVIATDGTFTYTPAPGFVGADAFTVQGCDNANPPACTTAVVQVTVVPATPVVPPVPPPDGGGGTIPPQVLPESLTDGEGTGTLPFTGGAAISLAEVGAALLAAGIAITWWRHRQGRLQVPFRP